MPRTATIKPTHKAITEYYASLQSITHQIASGLDLSHTLRNEGRPPNESEEGAKK